MFTSKLRFEREPDRNALQLIFALRRGTLRVLGVEPGRMQDVAGSRDGVRVEVIENRAVRVFWPPDIDAESVGLVLEAEGEALRLVSREWAFSDVGIHPVAPVFQKEAVSWDEVFCWREEQAKHGSHQQAKRLFNYLDRETLYIENGQIGPGLWENENVDPELRKRALRDLPGIIECGFLRRRSEGIEAELYSLDEDAEELLLAISTLFLDGYSTFFPSAGPGAGSCYIDRIDVPRVEEAQEQFATARLMLYPGVATDCFARDASDQVEQMKNACQPNSAAYFFFAELAYLCTSYLPSEHADVWRALLRAFVRSLKAFHLTYVGADRKCRFSDEVARESPPSSEELSRILSELTPLEKFKSYGEEDFLTAWRNYTNLYVEDFREHCLQAT